VKQKQQFLQDLKEAMRTNDQQRVNVIRLLLAAFENAQEAIGKQAFDSFPSDSVNIHPDRHQVLSEQAIQEIILFEIQCRREAVNLFRGGGQEKRAEIEETEITILEYYLTKKYVSS